MPRNPNRMDELPLELMEHVFDYLDLNDLIKARLVCKSFEQAVREVRIKELTFLQKPLFSADLLDLNWFALNEAKAPGRILHCPSEFVLSELFLTRKPFNIQLLKRLSICSLKMAGTGIDLEDLNRFQDLECLEITLDRNCKSFSRLSLPNLKALRIIDYFLRKPFEIVAPKLQSLKLPDRPNFSDKNDKRSKRESDELTDKVNAKLKRELGISNVCPDYKEPINYLRLSERAHTLLFRHSESVRSLTISKDLLFGSYIDKFKNVEWLRVKFDRTYEDGENDSEYDSDAILVPILSKFPKLKWLDCDAWESYVEKPILLELIAYLSSASESDIQIYCTDLKLSPDNLSLVSDYERCLKISVKKRVPTCYWDSQLNGQFALQLNHYSQLNDNVRSTRWICYNELESLLGTIPVGQWPVFGSKESASGRNSPANLLPIDFFEKFQNIRGIRVTSRIDQKQFAFFVKNCKKLRELWISDSQLGQSFFDELPAMSSLSVLKIKEANDLSMDFLLRISRLRAFWTNRRLSSKAALKMFRTEYGYVSECKIKSNPVKITRVSKGRFSIKNSDRSDFIVKEANLKSLIEHCDYLEKGPLSYYLTSILSSGRNFFKLG